MLTDGAVSAVSSPPSVVAFVRDTVADGDVVFGQNSRDMLKKGQHIRTYVDECPFFDECTGKVPIVAPTMRL